MAGREGLNGPDAIIRTRPFSFEKNQITDDFQKIKKAGLLAGFPLNQQS